MKRIIDGKTYNTETATKIAHQFFEEGSAEEAYSWNWLYQTRHGAYFLYYGDERWDDYQDIKPLSPAEAQAWMEKHASVELIEQHFGEMPEAGDAESRFTLRMPDSLKQRIDSAAKINNQSTNAWIVRALEKAANEQMQGEESR